MNRKKGYAIGEMIGRKDEGSTDQQLIKHHQFREKSSSISSIHKKSRDKNSLGKRNFDKVNADPRSQKEKLISSKSHKKIKQISPIITENISEDAFKKTTLNFKHILKKQKVNELANNFHKKIKRNLINSPPPENLYSNQDQEGRKKTCFSIEGIILPKAAEILFNFLYIAEFVSAFFIYGIGAAFNNQVQDQEWFRTFQYLSLILLFLHLLVNVACQKIVGEQRIMIIGEIFEDYVKSSFTIDLLCLIIVILDLANPWQGFSVLRLLFFVRIKDFLRRIHELEIIFVSNLERQHYWGVIKVFILNFLIAHVIAVTLILIAFGRRNWINTMGIEERPWGDKYSYAYFWAMSTMLGFGNVSPSNPTQAIFVSIIECLSCVIFAYVINHVGTLLSNISANNEERKKNLKISKKLAIENNISEELFSKVNNYIRQTDSIRKKFNLQSEKKFISQLPTDLKRDFLKQSNRRMFQHLFFFKYLTDKSLMSLAEKIEVKIAHPREILFRRKDDFKFLILKKGRVGYFSEDSGTRMKKAPIDTIEVMDGEKQRLLSLQIFQNCASDPKYILSAVDFSVIYEIDIQATLQTLKTSIFDYQRFCKLRDSSKHILDQFQLIQCTYCHTNHSKIKCPKLHYIPLSTMVIQRYLRLLKKSKNQRMRFGREKDLFISRPLKEYSSIFKKIERMIFQNFSKSQKGMMKSFSTRKKEAWAFVKSKETLTPLLLEEKLIVSDLMNEDSKIGTYIQEKVNLLMRDEHEKIKKQNQYIREKLSNLFDCSFEKEAKFWDIEIDRMKNYQIYFFQNNPVELKNICMESDLFRIQNYSKKILEMQKQTETNKQRFLFDQINEMGKPQFVNIDSEIEKTHEFSFD